MELVLRNGRLWVIGLEWRRFSLLLWQQSPHVSMAFSFVNVKHLCSFSFLVCEITAGWIHLAIVNLSLKNGVLWMKCYGWRIVTIRMKTKLPRHYAKRGDWECLLHPSLDDNIWCPSSSQMCCWKKMQHSGRPKGKQYQQNIILISFIALKYEGLIIVAKW